MVALLVYSMVGTLWKPMASKKVSSRPPDWIRFIMA